MSHRYSLSRRLVFFQFTYVVFLLFVSATIRPIILPEQEDFLERVLAIPFVERSWKRLITLDTLHAFVKDPSLLRKPDDLIRFREFVSILTRRLHFVLN